MQLWNTMRTTMLLAVLTGLFVLVGSALGGRAGMMVAFILAIGMNMGAWWFSAKLALRMSGARELGPAELPELREMTRSLAARAELAEPRLYIIESDVPNAFATGRNPQHGAVAVTTGLMHLLDPQELAGVVAHELAHIKHRDTLLSSLVATVAGAITMIAEMATWSLLFAGLGGGNEEEGGGLGEMVGSLMMILLAPFAALVIQLAISRAREFKADEGGAAILGDPLPLASALEKLEWSAGRIPAPETNPATSHLYIVNPLRGGMGDLFRTHPATEERIARLRALSRQRMVAA